jgi:uncharacterized membrane protein
MARAIGRIFVTGLLTVLPVVMTVYFAVWLLRLMEEFFGKQVDWLLPEGMYRTGMGIALAILVVFGVGLLMHAYVFRRLFDFFEKVLLEIPLIRSVYGALRDLLGLFAEHKEPALQVVAVRFGGGDTAMRLLGFVTRADFADVAKGLGGDGDVAVYLPMSYQIGGYTVFVPRSTLSPVDMSREDAMKFILTAGLQNASPGAVPKEADVKPGTP